MIIEKFLPYILFEAIDKHGEKIGDELTKGHPTRNACAETDLQSPALLKYRNQAPAFTLF